MPLLILDSRIRVFVQNNPAVLLPLTPGDYIWAKKLMLSTRRFISGELRVRFFKKIEDWILQSERIQKGILCFFTKQVNQKFSRIMVRQRYRRIHFQSGFFGSFDATWSEKSWIDLFRKETQNPFSDPFGFKNPIFHFLKETHPKAWLSSYFPEKIWGWSTFWGFVHNNINSWKTNISSKSESLTCRTYANKVTWLYTVRNPGKSLSKNGNSLQKGFNSVSELFKPETMCPLALKS